MASFESVLQIKGKEYNVLYSDFDVHQYTDSLGRPASPTFGGVYTLDIEAPPSGDSTLYEWMVEPGLFLNGQVLIKNLSSRTNLKVIKFYNAYCVDLEQHFDGTGLSGGERSLRLSLRVSPQAVNINGLMHDNDWPAPEPIVDWDWTEMDAACHPERQVKEEPSALSEGLHTLLDVVGMIPVVGEIADGANALLYAAEGDYANAALSAASMIPLAGNVVGAAKLAKRAVKVVSKVKKMIPPRLVSKLDEGAELLKKVCEKDPVDVATGMMLTQRIDIELPGPIPFVWERVWFSASDYKGSLGHGWHHRYDMGLTMDKASGMVVLRNAEGRHIVFEPSAQPGQPVLDRASGITLYPPAPNDPKGMPWRVWHQAAQVWYIFAAPRTQEAYQPLHAVANTSGQRIELGYEVNDRLAWIVDSAGRRLTFDHNEQGLLTGIYGPHPDQPDERLLLAGYEYSEAGDLTTYIDAAGNRWQHRYQHHLLVQTTTPNGLNFYWEYDGIDTEARCVHTWGDGGIHEGRFTYVDDHTTLLEDSDGITRYTHSNGLVVGKVDAAGGEWQWQYDDLDELTAEVDSLGATTRYGYDEGGNRIWTQYPDGVQVQTAYDDLDRPVTFTDARGSTWRYAYNEEGLPAQQTDPLGTVTRYDYDEQGRLVTVTNALGQATQVRYNEQHQVAHIVTPNEQIQSRDYDALGRLVKLTDPTGAVQQRRYDRTGQLTEVVEPDGSRQELVYDGEGNVLEARQGEQVVSFDYTGAGRLAERRQAGQRVAFRYDREGRLIGLTNEADEQYHFELNALGQVVTEVGFDGLTRRYERDAVGRVTRVLRPADRTTEYSYDTGGRVTKVTYSDSSWQHYAYDVMGDLVEARTADSLTEFKRNALGQVVAEQQNGHQVNSEYNQSGQRTRLTSSLGADVSFTLDALANVTQIKAGDWLADFGYDQRGLQVQRQLSGISTQWTYDTLGRPIRQRIQNRAGNQTRQRSYQWTGADQLASIDDSSTGLSQYQYDPVGTLTGAVYSDGSRDVRQADAVGNLYRSFNRQDRQYGPGGQLRQSEAGTRYRYDAEGNLIQKTLPDGSQWHYNWDGAGQLTSVRRPDGYLVSFTYDALGRRTSKHFRGKTTRWVWDGDKPLHEWTELTVGSGADGVEQVITWLFDEDSFAPLAKLQGTANYSVVTDHLGTPIEMYDGQGERTWQAELDSYGQVRQAVGKASDCPFRYQGQYEDVETGLYYNRFRYYDPQQGSYISQDPIRLKAGIALYNYVIAPTIWTDKYGLSGSEIFYRTMPLEHFEELVRTGKLPGTRETFISPTKAFSEAYEGVLVEFQMKPGATKALEQIGVRDASAIVKAKYPNMPVVSKGWNQVSAFFKGEGAQINIGLGKGKGLDVFNENIESFKKAVTACS